ncbi:O-antigen ligase family protein [Leptospira brenneri]|uniref:O-antigen ligase family protein n=1 Tax=Leptospira brenneri TaxID=2023182 RepID=A0A2M9Y2D4_9LEPT|nr:O-antigen ligase family protein [Leptospira brenneri]PJZ45728.1 ligase [Leptospira brenneri]TGK91627.1 O-antigen ligase family protein [Leptospira brenneri]
MIGKETFHKISVVFLYLFFVLSPFSISLCQIFAGASIFFFILDSIYRRQFPSLEPNLLIWILLYLGYLITPVLHWDTTNWKQTLLKSEFGDVWMAFLLTFHSRLSPEEKTGLKGAIRLGALALILSGILSLLSPYRLAPFVMDGFQYLEGRRLPHLLVHFLDKVSLYLPIGFQSTHLTYGGLLAIYLPSLWERTAKGWFIAKKKQKYRLSLIWYLVLSSLGVFLLFLNQSRSIWFGLVFGLFLISLHKKVSIKKYLPILGLGFFVLTILLFLFYQNNWLFQRAIDDLFAKRSLENQRVWIHKMNFAILKDFYIFGIGSGNYSFEFIEKANVIVARLPELYYDLSITPKSHAHFDLIHFWLLGGIISGISFLYFLYLETKNILEDTKHTIFYLGFFAIVFAGSFQCFLLDDEVLLPFLGILCLLPARKKRENFTGSKFTFQNSKNIFLLLFLWILISFLGALYLTKTPETELFVHRARTKHNFPTALAQASINASLPVAVQKGTGELYFKLSGCLDHTINFKETQRVRKTPVQLKIHWEEKVEGELPESLVLEIRKRESFDQDKEYRVQAERIVKTENFVHLRSKQTIQVDPKDHLGNELEFIDFGFLYTWKENVNPYLPRIEITGNCD